ncbi:MAG: DUF4177 domain-containing protein [Amylibacter sp.]
MQMFEYKAVPAPNRSKRVKGVKGTAGRFAAVLTQTMNEQAAEGWEYLRSDSLPVEEKPGMFKSKIETYQTVLVFRRAVAAPVETPMASYIENQSDIDEDVPAPAAEPVPAEPELATPDYTTKPELPSEPSVSSRWAEETDYPQDPPLTSQGDDSPFSQPESTDDDPFKR